MASSEERIFLRSRVDTPERGDLYSHQRGAAAPETGWRADDASLDICVMFTWLEGRDGVLLVCCEERG